MSTYRIEIDQSLCSGFGVCAELAPRVIELNPSGNARLLAGETDDDVVIEAAASCPMGAITVFESATGRRAA